jgi:hypothetical protein
MKPLVIAEKVIASRLRIEPGRAKVDALSATARVLGTSHRRARVALEGPMSLARRCARVIAALKAAGDDEALVRFIQPIDLAIHAAQPVTLADDALPGALLKVSPEDSAT